MELTAVRDLAASVAQVGARIAAERVRPVRLGRDPSIVPTSAAAITPEWLTAVLCRDVPRAKVIDVTLEEGHNGTSARQALSITYNDAGHRAALPRSLFSKATSTFTSRLLMGVTKITEGEAVFYNQIRPGLDIRSPRAFYAGADPVSRRSLVLLEDMRPAGVTFPAPMHNDLTRDDAAEMVLQMAAYHGALWDSPRFGGDLRRLRPSLEWQENLNRIDYVHRTLVGLERARDVVPDSIHRRRHELQPRFMTALRLHRSAPETLLHQDTHLGNWLRDADGHMGLYDWQCVSRGLWALDYSYAISVALPIEERRAWEKDLLRTYLDGLRAAGVADPPDFDKAWLAYRQQPLHALTLAFFSIGGSRFENQLQPMGYMLWAIERIATMVDDMETLDALG